MAISPTCQYWLLKISKVWRECRRHSTRHLINIPLSENVVLGFSLYSYTMWHYQRWAPEIIFWWYLKNRWVSKVFVKIVFVWNLIWFQSSIIKTTFEKIPLPSNNFFENPLKSSYSYIPHSKNIYNLTFVSHNPHKSAYKIQHFFGSIHLTETVLCLF